VKRTVYRVTLTADGAVIHVGQAYAPNSARRAAEAALRAIARDEGQTYSATGNWRVDDNYRPDRSTRAWLADRTYRSVVTTVERMP
jgi:hypothetical protein